MPITTSDLKLKLSIKTGSAGNSGAQADPNASLGKYISTTEITDNTLNNLFDDISGDENAAGTVDYRCVFIHNAHASLALQSAKVWLSGKRFTAAASNDTFTSTSHGFADGDAVRVEAELATDTLPAGVVNSTTYFVRDSAANTFKLAATAGGSAIDLTVDGSGAVRQFANTTPALSIDNAAASAIGSASAQAEQITNETTAPSAVGSFSSPITKSAGLSLGNIPAGQCRAFWVKRTALNNGARNNDGCSIRVEGDTAA